MDETAEGAADAAWAVFMGLVLMQRERVMDAAAAHGLSMPQAIALLQLDAERPQAMRDIAGTMRCDASFVTGLADRLEALGLVRRRVSAEDRRVKELVPTAKGERVRDELRGAWLQAPDAVRGLGDRDRRDLARIARHLSIAFPDDETANPFLRMAAQRARRTG